MENIFTDLNLFLDPPITEVGAMRKHLDSKIREWMNRYGDGSEYKVFVEIAKSYIDAGLPNLETQGRKAHDEQLEKLRSSAREVIQVGGAGMERNIKNTVSKFKIFFREETIRALFPSESSSSNQSDDEFVIPVCPASLKCRKPVPYADMCKISDALKFAGESSLYKLLGVNEREKTEDICKKATVMGKEINDMPKGSAKADALGRLAGFFGLFFKNDEERKNYDVAIKRFPFDKYATEKLTLHVAGWLANKKTKWTEYNACIDEVKGLKYTPEEVAWLVYEYFCITKKCPLPEKPKKGAGWGKYENLRAHLVYLFNDSIKYHELSNPRIKNKLQSVIERLDEITDPDSVESNVTMIIKEDLCGFWTKCKYDGIAPTSLFRPTTLDNFPFPKLSVWLESFTR